MLCSKDDLEILIVLPSSVLLRLHRHTSSFLVDVALGNYTQRLLFVW